MEEQMLLPQIIDIILIGIILITAVKAFKDGFFTSVVKLVGNIAGLIFSWILANKWSPMIFEKIFREKITAKVYSYIQTSENLTDIKAITEKFISGLPDSFVESFAEKAEQFIDGTVAPSVEIAQSITDSIIGPIITAVITIVIFAVLCSVFSFLSSLLAKALKTINYIPVLGFANRLGGFGVGVFSGIVNVIIISCLLSIIAVITQNSLSFINIELLKQSKILSLTSIINPFMG